MSANRAHHICTQCGMVNIGNLSACLACRTPFGPATGRTAPAGPASTSPQRAAGLFCPSCGMPLEPAVRFCTHCGRKLERL